MDRYQKPPKPYLGPSLQDFTDRARRTLNASPDEVLAAVPTVARASFAPTTIDSPSVLRFQTRLRDAASQSHAWNHYIVIRPTNVSIHRLGVFNRVGKFVEAHSITDFFFEALVDHRDVDCLLTIGEGSYYTRAPLGASLIDVLKDHGFESGLTKDL